MMYLQWVKTIVEVMYVVRKDTEARYYDRW